MSKNKVILYYLPNQEEQHESMVNVLTKLDIEGKRILESDLTLNIGFLAGVEDCDMISAGSDYKKPDRSFVIMHNLDDEEISKFLTALRQEKDLRVDLKAVITQHNMSWNCIDLVEELKKEHETMQAFMAARNSLNAARQWHERIIENKQQTAYAELTPLLEEKIERASLVIRRGERGMEMEIEELLKVRQDLAFLLQKLSLRQVELD